jgi:hypothetical protein
LKAYIFALCAAFAVVSSAPAIAATTPLAPPSNVLAALPTLRQIDKLGGWKATWVAYGEPPMKFGRELLRPLGRRRQLLGTIGRPRRRREDARDHSAVHV